MLHECKIEASALRLVKTTCTTTSLSLAQFLPVLRCFQFALKVRKKGRCAERSASGHHQKRKEEDDEDGGGAEKEMYSLELSTDKLTAVFSRLREATAGDGDVLLSEGSSSTWWAV